MDDWIGIISDTHGRLRPEVRRALEGCKHLVHAGDVGGEMVLEELRAIAPVSAVRGNTDYGPWARDLPAELTLECLGLRIHLLHELERLKVDPAGEKIDIVVYGHTHLPRAETEDGVLYLNPGSCGPRRAGKPVSLARVWPGPRQPYVESVELFPGLSGPRRPVLALIREERTTKSDADDMVRVGRAPRPKVPVELQHRRL